MWKKILIIIFLFYFFALLQNSFLAHFNLFGVAPNLIFVFFSLLVFFSSPAKNFIGDKEKDNFYQIVFLGALAGFFLDIFSYNYIGPSVILLIVIGFLAKKTQLLLKNRDDKFPLVYFSPIFLASFVVYQILLMIYLRYFDPSHYLISFDLRIIAGIIYNLFFATVGFWVLKKVIHVKKIQS